MTEICQKVMECGQHGWTDQASCEEGWIDSPEHGTECRDTEAYLACMPDCLALDCDGFAACDTDCWNAHCARSSR